jgi:hypothetical protein
MYQTIVDAMQALADAGSIFGTENSRKGEDQFQRALGGKLEQMTGIRWLELALRLRQ